MFIPRPNPLINEIPDWQNAGARHLWLPYTQMQTTPLGLPVAEAEGVHITLTNGRKLIDGVSSWWTTCHGYRHPHIEQAVRAQLQKLPHIMLGGLAHEPAYRLASKLATLCPASLSHVFFSDSGSVAVETAMKIALQYWVNKGKKGRNRFLSFYGGYHGDTLAAMSVCDPQEGMHRLLADTGKQQLFATIPHDEKSRAAFDALLDKHKHELAAVLIEPLVQGAGGMLFHSADSLRAVADACLRHNILLIADEIMVGLGRLGSMFACEEASITPDIMTLSKSLTGGTLPLAATIATTEIFNAFLSDESDKAFMHGPTYMGNPLACVAALASLELFEQEPRLAQAQAIEKQLQAELAPAKTLAGVRDVRVKGALGVIETDGLGDINWLKQRFVEEGVWLRPFGRVIYTMPPFIAKAEEISQITAAMVKITTEWAERKAEKKADER